MNPSSGLKPPFSSSSKSHNCRSVNTNEGVAGRRDSWINSSRIDSSRCTKSINLPCRPWGLLAICRFKFEPKNENWLPRYTRISQWAGDKVLIGNTSILEDEGSWTQVGANACKWSWWLACFHYQCSHALRRFGLYSLGEYSVRFAIFVMFCVWLIY